MSREKLQKSDASHPKGDNEWENRILCSDGNCIGVIGPDGRCKECGKPYEGEIPGPESQDFEPPDTNAVAEPSQSDPQIEAEDTEEAVEATDSDWEKRTLCSDGNCIGVIGPDGRCKECGKPYDPNAGE